MKAGVYKIYFTNDAKNKVYIGISNNLTRRKYDHKTALIENCHKNHFLQSAFKKYGADNFTFEILEVCQVCELKEKEKQYIEKYNSFNNKFGYNLTTGGEHFNLSETTKKKISVLKSGRKLSDKTKIKLAVHNLLKNRPELKVEVIDGKIFVEGKEYVKSKKGKFRTPEDDIEYLKKKEEYRKKKIEFITNYSTKRIKSEEEKEKIRKSRIGKKTSEETKKKIGSYHIGKEISAEHREGIKNKLGHKVILVDKDGKEIEFKSKSECCQIMGFNATTLRKYYNLKKTIKGFNIKDI